MVKRARTTIDPAWLGPRLVELRTAAGLARHELAERAGLTVTDSGRAGYARSAILENIEQGRTVPPWDVVCRLADALGIGVAEFATPPRKTRKGKE